MNITVNGTIKPYFEASKSNSNVQVKLANTALINEDNGAVMFGDLTNAVSTFKYEKSNNGAMSAGIVNPNTGSSAYSEWLVSNSTTLSAAGSLRLIRLGDNWSSIGAYKQAGVAIQAGDNITGGMSIMSTAANGRIRFYTGSYVDDSLRFVIGRVDSVPSATGGFLFQDAITKEVRRTAITPDGNGIYGGSGSLPSDITVTGGSNGITFTSTRTGTNSTVNINNTSSGRGLTANSTSGVGMYGSSTNSIGILGISTNSTGIWAQSSSADALYAQSPYTGGVATLVANPATTNTVHTVLNLTRSSTSAGANSIGGAIDFNTNNSFAAGSVTLSNRLISQLTTATSGSETSRFTISGINSGSSATVATFDGNGNATFGTTNSIVGTATNNDAVAGNIGEEFNSAVSTYTNYTTTATYQNIASITLTPGDWDLSAFFTFNSNSATITAAANAIYVISTTTASAAGATEGKNISYVPQAGLLSASMFSGAISPYRVSISGTTTYYLNTQATFTVGNPQFVGSIRARRVR